MCHDMSDKGGRETVPQLSVCPFLARTVPRIGMFSR